MSINGKCVAITKNGILQCKKTHKKDLIFCGTHNNSYPKNVCININPEDTFNKQDNNYIWKLINFKSIDITTNEINIERQKIIQEIKDEEAKLQFERLQLERQREEELNKIRICCVCYDEFQNSELIRCDKTNYEKRHFICSECLKGHITSLYSDGIATNSCMFDKNDKCGGIYLNKDIEKVINNEEMLNKWNEIINITEIFKLASICDDYIICPLCCKWGCIFEIPNGIRNNFYIKCGKCNKEFCNTCKMKAHDGRNCNQLEFEENVCVEKKIEIIDRLLNDIITKALMYNCSFCGTSYIKDEGCNLMTCPKCEALSCYLCGMKLYIKNNTKYSHFTGHDLADPDAICPLWNNKAGDGKENQGNKEFNENKLKDAVINFIFSNNMEIAKLIIDRFENLYKNDKDYEKFIDEIKNLII